VDSHAVVEMAEIFQVSFTWFPPMVTSCKITQYHSQDINIGTVKPEQRFIMLSLIAATTLLLTPI
jgi:hypothetical protein